jgi:iron-sulfur cluster repair protein YtfE (RIC family)
MTDPVYNREVLAELRQQHDDLRELLAACKAAADQVHETGSREGRPLVRSATLLLEAMARHNLLEEHRLRPILLESDSFGEVRLSQMLEDHIAEHAAVAEGLRDVVLIEDPVRAACSIRACLNRLRNLLDREERQYLNDRVVRDDIVSIDPTSG